MSNPAYLRGRALEWKVQRQFKDAAFGCLRMAGSHGIADLVVHRVGDAIEMMKPITLEEVDEVLVDWMTIHDPTQILEPYLYGRRKFLARGGTQTIHMTPATVWFLQAKSTKGK